MEVTAIATSPFSAPLYRKQFGDAELLAILSDARLVACMIETERALAMAEARCGLVPAQAADEIARILPTIEIDPADLAQGVCDAGVPVPALVAALRTRLGSQAGHWLHWGATSQDIMDTALMLQLRDVVAVLGARLDMLIGRLRELSDRYRDVVMAGRTRAQIATPITFGLKIAQWTRPLIEMRAAMPATEAGLLQVQFGGASGANSAIAPHGVAVNAALAKELGLRPAPPWHTGRTGLFSFAGWLGCMVTALAKMSADLISLSRPEIAEVAAGAGGGSSTMPHKSNPVACEAIIALADYARMLSAGLQTHASHADERDGSRWTLEWFILPELVLAVGSALNKAVALAPKITARPERMLQNLTASGAMAEHASFKLAAHMPRAEAQVQVKAAAKLAQDENIALGEALSRLCDVPIAWISVLDPRSAIAPSEQQRQQILTSAARHNPGA